MSDALALVLSRLNGVRGGDRKRSALCPAHDDRNASLSVSLGDDGRVLLCCHAGCTTKAICTALNIHERDLFPRNGPMTQKKNVGTIIATYDYRDAEGALRFQCVRFDPKGFRQRRPDGGGGWVWDLKGVTRVLYRLPELTASDPTARIFVCEGEKDCDSLIALGILATTCPMGAGKWKHLHDDSILNGHPIVILPDSDPKGREHAQDVAGRLHGRVPEIRVLDLPGDGKDVSDWLGAGGTKEELLALVESSPVFQFEEQGSAKESNEDQDEKRKSQATVLVGLAAAADLFHSDDVAYASVIINRNIETFPVRSKGFKRWMARQFFLQEEKAPGAQALADALTVIEGTALFEGPEIAVHLRTAELDGVIYVDLADKKRHVVEVARGEWRVIHNPPVRFRRPRAFRGLPIPKRGGTLTALRRFINVRDDDAFILLVAWIVAAFRPGRPFVILVFNSEQGSGKTTASRMLRMVIDPNESAVRCEPREPRDLMIAANNGWIAAFDNLSHVKVWLSDAFCRLSTGGGLSTRMLYENDEECIFDALRPVLLNGIDEIGTRSDLLDRMIRIALPCIAEDQRVPEDELYRAFEAELPLILGAVLDAVSVALSRVEDVRLDRYPRMADFTKWVVAAEPALPWNEGDFVRAYLGQRDSAHELALESCTIVDPLRAFVDDRGTWTGKASELLKELNRIADNETRQRDDWPSRPNVLGSQLRRLAPNLRQVGIECEFPRPGHRGRALVIRKVAQKTVATVADRRTPENWPENDGARDDEPSHRDDDATMVDHAEWPDATHRDDRDDDLPTRSSVDDLIDAEERAAIMEYDGGLSLEEAERRAGLHLLNGEMSQDR